MVVMRAELIRGITIRPLRNGETEAVQAVFDRLGPRSRLLRFGGAKNVLSPAELRELARVDGDHHVLVALHEGEPVGIARLVRDGSVAEVAFAVADAWQRSGVGTALIDRLAADARAAGIQELRATMHGDNAPSLALMRRVTQGLRVCSAGGQLEVVGRAA
jgi:N-acetylglutamate synthase-like GNAT family acetyltransferase